MTLIYKNDRMPQVAIDVLQEMGWEEFDENKHADDEWNIYWKP